MEELIVARDFNILVDNNECLRSHGLTPMNNILTIALMTMIGLAGCGRPSADEYFTLAENARNAGDMNIALDNYRQVVQHYPQSDKAEESQFVIASILQNNLRQYPEAVAEYRRFEHLFPHSSKAPAAVFLEGYIFNNELKNNDSAAAAYKRFLAAYPEHEMAASAQFELEHLGKSPEELLPPSTDQHHPLPPSTRPTGGQ